MEMVKVDLKDLESEFLKKYGYFGITKIKAIKDYVTVAREEEKKETLLLKYLRKFCNSYESYVNSKQKNDFYVTEDEFMALDEICEFWVKQFEEEKGE